VFNCDISFSAIYSDFNLFFPGGKGNYVAQRFRDFRRDNHLVIMVYRAFTVSLWVRYSDGSLPRLPILSFFTGTKTILKAILVKSTVNDARLTLHFGVNSLER